MLDGEIIDAMMQANGPVNSVRFAFAFCQVAAAAERLARRRLPAPKGAERARTSRKSWIDPELRAL